MPEEQHGAENESNSQYALLQSLLKLAVAPITVPVKIMGRIVEGVADVIEQGEDGRLTRDSDGRDHKGDWGRHR